jgi:hypothetical protein
VKAKTPLERVFLCRAGRTRTCNPGFGGLSERVLWLGLRRPSPAQLRSARSAQAGKDRGKVCGRLSGSREVAAGRGSALGLAEAEVKRRFGSSGGVVAWLVGELRGAAKS